MRDLLGQEIKVGDSIAYVHRTAKLAVANVRVFSEEQGTIKVFRGPDTIENGVIGRYTLVVTKLFNCNESGSGLSDGFGASLKVGDWVIGTRPHRPSFLVGKITSFDAMGIDNHVEIDVIGSRFDFFADANYLIRITELPALTTWLMMR